MSRHRRIWTLCFTLLLLHQSLKASAASTAAPAAAPEPSQNATARLSPSSTPPKSSPAAVESTAAPVESTAPPPKQSAAILTPPPPLGSPEPSSGSPVSNSSKKGSAPAPAIMPVAGTNGTLDPAQARALTALGISVGPDPCNTAAQRNLICDDSVPYKHAIYLQLQYCTMGQVFPASAWDNLTTLQSLYFSDCPAKQMVLPKELLETVSTLQVVASLGRSVENVLAQGLTGVWLSKFYNVRKLVVQDVVVNVSTLSFIVNNMTHLQELSFSNTNLTGPLPNKWASAGLLTSLEISGNELEGGIPASLTQLAKLNSLDFSACNLSGSIPSAIGNLSRLQILKLGSNRLRGPMPTSLQKLVTLQYLDLSDNQLNGSVPAFLAHLPALRYLDLSKNNLKGQIPFNSSFIKSLNTFKVGGNAQLCYNSSLLSSKLVTGLQPCDTNGLPPVTSGDLSPSPAPAPQSQGRMPSSSHHHGPKRIVLIVAIALASIIGIIIIAIVLSRCCSSKG